MKKPEVLGLFWTVDEAMNDATLESSVVFPTPPLLLKKQTVCMVILPY